MKLVSCKTSGEVLHAGDAQLQKSLSGELVWCQNHPLKLWREPVLLGHVYECGQIKDNVSDNSLLSLLIYTTSKDKMLAGKKNKHKELGVDLY